MTTIPNKVPQKIQVGVAEMGCVRAPTGVLMTRALGSCIGLCVFDPETNVGGLLHFMLPERTAGDNMFDKPAAMFATTGIPKLFRDAYKLGADRSRLVICAAGGASLMGDQNHYQIGKRNKMMMHKMFWKNGIRLNAEDTGGSLARTLVLRLDTGRVTVQSKREEAVLWSA